MSDVSQGPGWWIASDGKWYPPHLHPSAVQAPPQTTLPPPPIAQTQPVVTSSIGAGVGPYGPPPISPSQWPTGPYVPPTYPAGYGPPPGMGLSPYQNPNARIDPVLRLSLSPWWKRLVAIIVDGFVLAIPIFIVFAVIGAAAGNHNANTTNTQPAPAGALILGFIFLIVLASIPGLLYYGFMNGSKRGQTVGKMALGIAVRDARTGGPIGFGRGMGRFAMMQLFYVLLLVPYVLDNLSPLWDARRQAWHDKAVHSVVVETQS
jgi:uncharacterized RDD family membrane protein YckC